MGAMHAALGGGFLVLLDCHFKLLKLLFLKNYNFPFRADNALKGLTFSSNTSFVAPPA